MTKRLLLLLCLLPTLAYAGVVVLIGFGSGVSRQLILGWTDDTIPTTATTRWAALSGPESIAFTSAGYWQTDSLIAEDGVLGPCSVTYSGNIGDSAGDAVQFNVLYGSGSSTPVTSAIACTLTDGDASETYCADLDTIAVTAGDRVTVSFVTTNTPVAVSAEWSCLSTSTHKSYSMILGHTIHDANADRYYQPSGNMTAASTQGGRKTIMPFSGTVRHVYLYAGTAPGAATSRQFSIIRCPTLNGTCAQFSTPLNCTISDTNVTCTMTGDGSQTFAIGEDLMLFATTTAGAPVNSEMGWGVQIESDSPDRFLLHTNANVGTANRYFTISAATHTSATTETNMDIHAGYGFTAHSLYVGVASTPGQSADADIITFDRDTATNSGLSCTLTVPDVGCNDTDNGGNGTVAAGAAVAHEILIVNTPTVVGARIGIGATIP